jgi:hypothetical protein
MVSSDELGFDSKVATNAKNFSWVTKEHNLKKTR